MKCELTDGVDVFEAREMTEGELKAANSECRKVTGSNMYWTCEPYSDPCPSYGEDGDIHGTKGETMTSTGTAQYDADARHCKGHVFTVAHDGTWPHHADEVFRSDDGDYYVSRTDNLIDCRTGYRTGGRFLADGSHDDRYLLALFGIADLSAGERAAL